MCGIAGFIHSDTDRTEGASQLDLMLQSIRYRGPDDSGMWFDDSRGVSLGHCRLSILDLSSAGHQPMVSPGERYTLIFNGEIYNHLDLRRELGSAVQWRGHSDTDSRFRGLSLAIGVSALSARQEVIGAGRAK